MASNPPPIDHPGETPPSPSIEPPPQRPPSQPQKPPRYDPPEPITQETRKTREWLPEWFKYLPKLRFNEFDESPAFQLLPEDELNAMLATCTPEAAQSILPDLHVLDKEVLRLFRRLDYEAARQQNRYRRSQLMYALLALAATIVGSVMALTLESAPGLTPWLGGIETIIAGLTSFIAALTADEPPQQLWLQNRLKAEHLRREYFRYLMRLEPYDGIEDRFDRETLLAKRAADINRGFFPESPVQPK